MAIRSWRFPLVAALLFLFPAAALADDASLDAPPPNLTPTSVHLSAILAQHDAAVGKPTGADTVIEDWRFTDSGVSGTLHLERSGTDYHSRLVEGPFTEEFGQLNGKRWHRDYNGFVTPTTRTDDVTFFAERINEDAADPKNDASVAGVTQGTAPAYVVRVKVSDEEHPEWIFYGVASGLISRVEWVTGKHRIVSLYDDFRTTGGVTTAWHVHDDWDPPELDDDYVRTGLQQGVAVNEAQFGQPSSAPVDGPQNIGFTIPAHMYNDGTIIMRMNVNGRGLDMLLDTAVNGDIIDEGVARQMGLPTFGHVDRAGGGDVPFETILPVSSIGPFVRTNLAIYAEPFTSFQWSSAIEVVGVLGYDFLSSNVFKIDYYNAKIQLIPAAQFDADDPVPGGVIYPIDFDDGLPFLTVGIGDVTSDNVLLANEILHTEFFDSFLEAHSDVFATSSETRQEEDLPFADNDQFGRNVEEWETQPTDIHFGLVNFQQPLVRASNYPLYLSEDRPVDAALGWDFLKFFDVYLDYPHDRIIVKPNQFFMNMIHHA